VASINQTGAGIRLPNFCNLGVMLRVMVVANLFLLAAAVLRARHPAEIGEQLLGGAAFFEPVLIVSLVLLCAARRLLHALSYAAAIAAVLALELALALGWVLLLGDLFALKSPVPMLQAAFFAVLVSGFTLAYLDLRARAQSPAIAEARIQALQARIRPHFLYNSINAVLSFIRSDPKRAERALEDLADVFRMLMAEDKALAPLAREVDIARQYLAIEALRLGSRLRVSWRLEGMPEAALVPSLLLQPLVENAVYHGIEPLDAGGEIEIEVRSAGEQVHIRVTNPFISAIDHHPGSRMALANIRERLQLHFDAEASLQTRAADGAYQVDIRLPLITAAP
jgi:two-component system sensor histidine kinase AlgZ